ncbi:MAG TPA: ribosome biogenesis GTP-binding protein YihA/YsxC [Myxococcota bacterium]|nr:ribosome biogenesis GTP-binding protein YihA/YsxC [Myxococcota bacterium]
MNARWVASAAGPEGFPRSGLPEIALLGRSNAGKSSLLNRLVARRELARVSKTPGKTRLVHFYEVSRGARRLLLVDLPGYGFARVSKAERARWQKLVEGYLEGRASLAGAVLLQDLRRDASDDERDLLAWLAERGVPALVALTKADKLAPSRRGERARALAAALELPPDRVIATSAHAKLGIDALWRAIGVWLGAD